MIKIRIITILTLSFLLCSYSLKAEEKNYCEDTDANKQWEVLIQKNPDNLQFHALHALRLGLCLKVDRSDLTIDQATEIFENMRSDWINAMANEIEKELNNGKNKKKNL
jgi:hypothetical protein